LQEHPLLAALSSKNRDKSNNKQMAVELEQRVAQLTIKDKQQNSIIERKLAEKDLQFEEMQKQILFSLRSSILYCRISNRIR
jgi:hypothetical protein